VLSFIKIALYFELVQAKKTNLCLIGVDIYQKFIF
jgi:hypothetical protein